MTTNCKTYLLIFGIPALIYSIFAGLTIWLALTKPTPSIGEPTRLIIIDGPLKINGPTGRAEVNLWIIQDTETKKEFVYSVGGIANTSICPLNK